MVSFMIMRLLGARELEACVLPSPSKRYERDGACNIMRKFAIFRLFVLGILRTLEMSLIHGALQPSSNHR
uniref:Putative secreted protein n=1 Tax=Anopheles marajoara TaxID=58244 RepID=A0A2M4CEN9_9DIPT